MAAALQTHELHRSPSFRLSPIALRESRELAATTLAGTSFQRAALASVTSGARYARFEPASIAASVPAVDMPHSTTYNVH